MGFWTLCVIPVTFSVLKAAEALKIKWNIFDQIKFNDFEYILNNFFDSMASKKVPIQNVYLNFQIGSNSK